MKVAFFRINKLINEQLYVDFKVFIKTKVSNGEPLDFVYLLFDSKGGEMFFAAKIINMMIDSRIKFIGIAYKEVHSAAIPIFLSTQIRFGYSQASALIHRATKSDINVSDRAMRKSERQVFKLIAEKLAITMEDVYKLANENTYITMQHPLGKKFFIGN